MKHLQTFELYKSYGRVLGFKYSEPSVIIDVMVYYIGQVPTEESIKNILEDIKVPVFNIDITEELEKLIIPVKLAIGEVT